MSHTVLASLDAALASLGADESDEEMGFEPLALRVDDDEMDTESRHQSEERAFHACTRVVYISNTR